MGKAGPKKLTTEASFYNNKIPLKVFTILSLFQWKADKRSLAIRLLQVHLPPRTELGKNFLSEHKRPDIWSDALHLRKRERPVLPWNPSAHSKQDIPMMASSSWTSSTASEPEKRSRGAWLLLGQGVSMHLCAGRSSSCQCGWIICLLQVLLLASGFSFLVSKRTFTSCEFHMYDKT